MIARYAGKRGEQGDEAASRLSSPGIERGLAGRTFIVAEETDNSSLQQS